MGNSGVVGAKDAVNGEFASVGGLGGDIAGSEAADHDLALEGDGRLEVAKWAGEV